MDARSGGLGGGAPKIVWRGPIRSSVAGIFTIPSKRAADKSRRPKNDGSGDDAAVTAGFVGVGGERLTHDEVAVALDTQA